MCKVLKYFKIMVQHGSYDEEVVLILKGLRLGFCLFLKFGHCQAILVRVLMLNF